MNKKLVMLIFVIITYTTYGLTTCPVNQFYFNNQCYTNCTYQNYLAQNNGTNPDNITELYVKTNGSNACVSTCSSECLLCSGFADFCTQCKQPIMGNGIAFLLESNGLCFVNFCPDYYYTNFTSQKCILCSNVNQNCQNCSSNINCSIGGGLQVCNQSNEVICLSCDSGYYSLTDQNGILECLSIIPDGYASVNNVLIACSGDCLTCVGDPSNCLSCKTLSFLNNQCITQCPFSHYSKQITTLFNSSLISTLICQRCEPPCNTCLNSTFCISCLINYFLISANGSCVINTQCPSYTYPNTTTYKCEYCVQPCLNCLNQNQCQSCVQGFFLMGNECLSQCLERTFAEIVTNPNNVSQSLSVCTSCVAPCDTCLNGTLCLSCLNSSQLIYFSIDNACLSQCPIGYKPDTSKTNCDQCPQNCSACNTQSCTECKTINGIQFYLFNNNQTCIESCPISYYVSIFSDQQTNSTISLCVSCPKQCLICQNQTHCTQCNSNYFFYQQNNSCLDNCPSTAPVEKLISNESYLYECLTCSKQFCLQCTNADYCIKCQNESSLILSEATILSNGQCTTSCSLNYTKQYSNTTQKWICKQIIIIIPQNNTTNKNNTQTTIIESQSKGIIIPIFVQFIASYVNAGVFISFGCLFLGFKVFSNRQRLFLPFVAGFSAIIETLAISYVLFYHIMYNYNDIFQRVYIKPQTIVISASIIFLILVNLVCFGIFCRILHNDISFKHWRTHNSICSKFWFVVIFTLAMINFKVMNIFWSKFSFFPVLSTVEKLKPFTVISGTSLISILGFIVSFILISNQQPEIKTIYYDGIAVLLFCNLMNLFSLKRPQDLFVFQADVRDYDSGVEEIVGDSKITVNLHKRVFDTDALFFNSMKPTAYEEKDQQLQYQRTNYGRLKGDETVINSQRSLDSSMSIKLYSDQIVVLSNDNKDEKSSYCQYEVVEQNRKLNIAHHNENLRMYNSLTGIYSQSLSEIQTDECTASEELNQAISEIDEGSEKAQFGSAIQEQSYVQDVQNHRQSDKCSVKQVEFEKKDEKIKQIIIEPIKVQIINTLKRTDEEIPNQIYNHEQQEIIDPSIHNSEDFVKFLDISQMKINKQTLLGIDNSNQALFEDSVYVVSHKTTSSQYNKQNSSVMNNSSFSQKTSQENQSNQSYESYSNQYEVNCQSIITQSKERNSKQQEALMSEQIEDILQDSKNNRILSRIMPVVYEKQDNDNNVKFSQRKKHYKDKNYEQESFLSFKKSQRQLDKIPQVDNQSGDNENFQLMLESKREYVSQNKSDKEEIELRNMQNNLLDNLKTNNEEILFVNNPTYYYRDVDYDQHSKSILEAGNQQKLEPQQKQRMKSFRRKKNSKSMPQQQS